MKTIIKYGQGIIWFLQLYNFCRSEIRKAISETKYLSVKYRSLCVFECIFQKYPVTQTINTTHLAQGKKLYDQFYINFFSRILKCKYKVTKLTTFQD